MISGNISKTNTGVFIAMVLRCFRQNLLILIGYLCNVFIFNVFYLKNVWKIKKHQKRKKCDKNKKTQKKRF